MARNGSGVYSLPAGNPVTTATTISSTWANTTLSDIATALTGSIAKDGQTSPTANLPMGSLVLTGLGAGTADGHSLRYEQLFSQGAPTDIASAATTDIGAVRSNFLTVTGTTGITSLGTNYNGPKMLRFSGALTLTHHATTLVLPGAANLTTVAGDTCVAIPKSTASGTPDGWNIVMYSRSAGYAVAGTYAATGANNDITSLTALTAGGLPDNSILTNDIAALQVTGAKIAASTITADKLSGAQTGSAPIYACRAWCLFDGTVTGTNAPTAGGNVTQVTRSSAGVYTIDFTTALADANYAVICTTVTGASGGTQYIVGVQAAGATSAPTVKSTTQVRIYSHSSTPTLAAQDMKEIYVSILR